jgi:hypothetical protein
MPGGGAKTGGKTKDKKKKKQRSNTEQEDVGKAKKPSGHEYLGEEEEF